MAQGGDFMPKLLGIIWIGLSFLILVSDLKDSVHSKKVTAGINLKQFISTLALIFFYILIIEYLGFTISSIFYLFIQILIINPKKIQSRKVYIGYGLIALITPIAISLIFANLFYLILPRGIF